MMKYVFITLMAIAISGCDLTENEGFRFPRQLSGSKIVRDFISATIRPDSTVWTWGPGFLGTLGNGSLESSETPVRAIGIANITAIDLCGGIAVAANSKGDIYFWGDNFFYLESPGLDTIVTVPTIISHLYGIKSIVIGIRQLFLFLREDGTVWYLQHDHNSPTRYLKPTRIQGLVDVIQITESYALKADGTLFNIIATIPNENSPPPNRGGLIQYLNDIEQVENVWFRRTVILKSDGTVWAWGWNDFGQLGNGSFLDSEKPVRVGDLNNIIAISAHYDYNLALTRDGTVWFWGLEKPHEKSGRNSPIKIQNLKKASEIYADYNNLVLCEDGSYWTFNVEDKTPVQIDFE